jgi:RNA polymerase sigma-70 factor, ECF subfamily
VALQNPQQRSDELARLVGRVALRDRAAFAEVYRRTADHLLGIAYTVLHDEGRAEDALQEAFVNVWNSAPQYNPGVAAPMTWLINIVRNKAIDKSRSGRGEREATVALDDSVYEIAADEGATPHALLDDGLVKARIDGCMADLGAPQRQAIALAYYRGLVHTEIAEALGAPLGTVKAWVRRGLDRLRDCLRAAGVEAA